MRHLRHLRGLIVLLAVFVYAGSSIAQSAKPTRIVITLNDGKTVSGELVEVTPAGVTLKPNPKAEPVMTPWSTIKRVGGGISREQIIAEWQKTKADQICETCRAEATTQCATCEGKSVDPAQATACEKCAGSGSTGKCRTPKEIDGKISCPDTCLKADSFTGPKDADGKRWRQFRGKGGSSMRVSDGHVGERVVTTDGVPSLTGKCPTCDGTTIVVDPACKGTGKTTCVTCKGHGVTGPDCAACEAGKLPCSTCSGTGLKTATTATPAN